MRPELVLALSNLSNIYGVMLGTLESLSTSHPSAEVRVSLDQLVADAIEQNALHAFVEELANESPTIIWKDADGK